MDITSYSMVFGQGCNNTVRSIVTLVKEKNANCRLCTLEEGTGTYSVEYICDKVKSDYIYLYDPEVVVYNSEVEIKKIVSIEKDEGFVKNINYVFDYNANEEYKGKIIFFDKYAEDMPEYLSKHKWLAHTVLRNAYKKHLDEANVYRLQKKVFDLLCEYREDRKIIVKLHPTTKREDVKEYIRREGVEFAKDNSVPWEVVCLNGIVENNIIVSHMTSAFRSKCIVSQKDSSNKYIAFIDMISVGRKNENIMFLRKWAKFRNINLFLPRCMDECVDMIKKLMKN